MPGDRRHPDGPGLAFGGAMKLDDVGLADQAEPLATQGHSTQNAEVSPSLDETSVGALVEETTFCRLSVFLPDPLEVNQRTLTLAVDQVLEGRERQKGIVVHGGPTAARGAGRRWGDRRDRR